MEAASGGGPAPTPGSWFAGLTLKNQQPHSPLKICNRRAWFHCLANPAAALCAHSMFCRWGVVKGVRFHLFSICSFHNPLCSHSSALQRPLCSHSTALPCPLSSHSPTFHTFGPHTVLPSTSSVLPQSCPPCPLCSHSPSL